jgi:hypothetical protein
MSMLDLAAKDYKTFLYNRYPAARDNIHRTDRRLLIISDGQVDVSEAGPLAQKMIDSSLDVCQTRPGLKANGIDCPAGSWVSTDPFCPWPRICWNAR